DQGLRWLARGCRGRQSQPYSAVSDSFRSGQSGSAQPDCSPEGDGIAAGCSSTAQTGDEKIRSTRDNRLSTLLFLAASRSYWRYFFSRPNHGSGEAGPTTAIA